MGEVLLTLNGFSVYTLSFFIVIGFLWYGFIVYKKGQEYHYGEDTLLDFVISSGILAWVFGRLGFVLENIGTFKDNLLRVIFLHSYPGYSFWGLLLGLSIANKIMAKKSEVKTYEGLDLIGLALPAGMALERIGRVLSGEVHLVMNVPIELFEALLFLVIFVWLWKLEKEYRTFEWYRYRKTQARPGFIFGMFLVLGGLGFIVTGVYPKLIAVQVIQGVIGLIAGIVTLYRRSGRALSHDLSILIKKFKR